ncbi:MULTISPECIES: hypothetical protein [Halocynthiibacter]|uniref:AAA+ family ATPase n=1 Tax=Halocynthiibacter halioticoli TaxID=2986804 RepID=A0AAE3IZ46_9RHOB|nr:MULTISPECIES: hypothetical protein [Halocynthiibacter]MCV6823790.1 hypothetical protein [Halocynthiibacter halioticoli]MCW4056791.1 hypothetical protein [Halocynthiibacter sp. SDUM655004]
MKRFALALVSSVCVALAAPVAMAQDEQMEEGADLVERGMRLLFEGLMEEIKPNLNEMMDLGEEIAPKVQALIDLMGNAENYEAPEILPNGDILIRKKRDLKEGEIEL